MKRHLLLFLALTAVFGSCTNHDVYNNSCAVVNPVTDLAWLAAEVQTMEQSEISQYQYFVQARNGSQTVFILADCCPMCNSIYLVFNCAGERIGYIGDSNFDFKMLEEGKVIWKASNSSCTR